MTEPEPVSLEALAIYAQGLGLGHDERRLAELAPGVRDLFARLRRLRELDVGDAEMAITFVPRGWEAPRD